MRRREAWLLLPLFGTAFIAGLVVSLQWNALAVLLAVVTVLVSGLGAWGAWRFLRDDRPDGILRPARVANRPSGTTWAWPLLALIGGFYGLSLMMGTRLSRGGIQPDYRLFFGDMASSPHWLANPALLIGCWALMARRWLSAGLAGTIATLLALWPMGSGEAEWASTSHAGYKLWLASMVLLAGGGFHGWWKTRREARAGDIKAAVLGFAPPGPDPTRVFDGP